MSLHSVVTAACGPLAVLLGLGASLPVLAQDSAPAAPASPSPAAAAPTAESAASAPAPESASPAPATTPAAAPAPVAASHPDESPSREKPLSGTIGLTYTNSRTAYHSYRLTTDIDLTHRQPGQELLTEIRIDREDIQVPGDDSRTVSTDEYDASLKWKYFDDSKIYYLYGSPRLRHNRFSYYKNSQAVRVGIGRRIIDEPLSVDLEIGTGHRWAQGHDGAEVSQSLYTLTTRLEYDFSKTLSARLNLVTEKAAQERYTTLSASLNSPLVGQLYVRYEMSYRRIFPFDSGQLTSETSYNFGLGYRI